MHSACRAFNIVMQSGWAVLGVSRRHRLALTVWLGVAAWLRKNSLPLMPSSVNSVGV